MINIGHIQSYLTSIALSGSFRAKFDADRVLSCSALPGLRDSPSLKTIASTLAGGLFYFETNRQGLET